MASASWILEQQRAEAEQVERYAQLDVVIMRLQMMEQRERDTSAFLARHPNGNGAEALQRANDLRQAIAVLAHYQANLDRVHLLEQPSRLLKKTGSGR